MLYIFYCGLGDLIFFSLSPFLFNVHAAPPPNDIFFVSWGEVCYFYLLDIFITLFAKSEPKSEFAS
jgi:hypothetical protein